jgi:hypothetical protein
VREQVPAHPPRRVGQPTGTCVGGRVQQQPGVLHAERRQHVDVGGLPVRRTVLHVDHAGDRAVVVVSLALDRSGGGADLRAGEDRLWGVGDVHRALGAALAAPLAVAVVHARRAALVPAGEDGQGVGRPPNPVRLHAVSDQQVPRGQPVRRLRVGMRMRSPRHVLKPGQPQLGLDPFVVRLQVGVPDGPVLADTVEGPAAEVLRPHPHRHPTEVDGATTDPAAVAAVAELELLLPGQPAPVVPVEASQHAQLVLAQVHLGVQPFPGLQHHHPPPTLGQLLGQHRPARAAADDAHVDVALVAAHRHRSGALLQGRGHSHRYPTRRAARATSSPSSSHT